MPGYPECPVCPYEGDPGKTCHAFAAKNRRICELIELGRQWEARVVELTEAMGIGSPSLYAAFGSKEALYAEALVHSGAITWNRLIELLTGLPGEALPEPHRALVLEEMKLALVRARAQGGAQR